MGKDLSEANIVNNTTNNTVYNYGTINGDVTAAKYLTASENELDEHCTIRPNFEDSERESQDRKSVV